MLVIGHQFAHNDEIIGEQVWIFVNQHVIVPITLSMPALVLSLPIISHPILKVLVLRVTNIGMGKLQELPLEE